jgi:hypothetical protein
MKKRLQRPCDPEQAMKLERVVADPKGISDGLSGLLFKFTRQYLTIYDHVAHDPFLQAASMPRSRFNALCRGRL